MDVRNNCKYSFDGCFQFVILFNKVNINHDNFENITKMSQFRYTPIPIMESLGMLHFDWAFWK